MMTGAFSQTSVSYFQAQVELFNIQSCSHHPLAYSFKACDCYQCRLSTVQDDSEHGRYHSEYKSALYIYLSIYRAIEHCLARSPEHSNLKNDYGCTILHLAAFYNHCDIVNLAAEQVRDQFGVLECCYPNYLSIYICAQV